MPSRIPILVALLGAPVAAQVGGPSTAPATQPATSPSTTQSTTRPAGPADLSSPKSTLRTFATALYHGDADRLRQVVATTAPAEERMVTAMAEMSAAVLRLHGSAARAFGDAGAARFTGDAAGQLAESLKRIEGAEVTFDGDRAAIQYPGAAAPEYELRKVGGQWKIPVAQFSHGADGPTLDRRVAESAVQARIILELVAEIDAGKYKTPDAASEAWRGKIMQGLGIAPPATKGS